MIERAVHQIWIDNEIPDHIRVLQYKNIDNLDDIGYRIWGNEIFDFLGLNRGELEEAWQFSNAHPSFIVDILRVALIYKVGYKHRTTCGNTQACRRRTRNITRSAGIK